MVDLLLTWNVQDPVNSYEQNRNDIIYNNQGNRNPFIDNPYLATLIWGGSTAQNFWTEVGIEEKDYLFKYGEHASRCVIILSGKVRIISGRDQFAFDSTNYTVLGTY